MKILLTGITGRIGSHFLKGFSDRGYHIHGLVSPQRDASDIKYGDRVDKVYSGDILNVDDWVLALDGVDAVVHLAGRSEESADALQLNTMSTHALVKGCSIVGVRKIVFASSNCVLGQCYDERHLLAPCMDYGVSKQCAELVLEAASERFGIQSVALRLAWMLSDEDCRNKVWESLSETIQASSMWAYLHLDDAINAFCLAVEADLTEQFGQGKGAFRALYLSAADTFSNIESSLLAKQYYPDLQPTDIALTGHQSFYSWRDAEDAIGYVPQHPWRDLNA